MGELDGKTALVTGGGKGIGRAISQALAGMGAKVVVNYRSDKAAAEETASTLPGATVHQADVGDPAQVDAMVKAIGRVDVLVNNAGAVRDKLLIQMSPPDWEVQLRCGEGWPDRVHEVDRPRVRVAEHHVQRGRTRLRTD